MRYFFYVLFFYFFTTQITFHVEIIFGCNIITIVWKLAPSFLLRLQSIIVSKIEKNFLIIHEIVWTSILMKKINIDKKFLKEENDVPLKLKYTFTAFISWQPLNYNIGGNHPLPSIVRWQRWRVFDLKCEKFDDQAKPYKDNKTKRISLARDTPDVRWYYYILITKGFLLSARFRPLALRQETILSKCLVKFTMSTYC